MPRNQFRDDIRNSKKILEDIIGEKVAGYRAPSYSITWESLWALEILVEEGYFYDSSIFPIHHDRYGIPKAPRFPFVVDFNGDSSFRFIPFDVGAMLSGSNGSNIERSDTPTFNEESPLRLASDASRCLIEFPISTVHIFRQNLPISGGGYFRLFPYSLVKKGLKRINKVEKKPFTFYVHPWEFDPDQPRLKSLSFKSKFRHYINLEKTESKFRKLLRDFQFAPMRNVMNHCLNSSRRADSIKAIEIINPITPMPDPLTRNSWFM
jgi:polysaccharide deacetylase family protein (PEP-CTERM system associated)